MKLRMFFSAAFKPRNLLLLAAVAIISYVTGYLPFTFIGFAGYIYFVMQTLQDEKFHKEFMEAEKLDSLQRLSVECGKLFGSIRYKLDHNSRERVKKVLRLKDELMSFFNRDRSNPLNRTIIEQALNLVMAYIKLIYTYSNRYKEISSIDLSSITARVTRNNRKLGSLKSYEAVLQLTKAIEMDETLLQNIRNEKLELENVGVKLDHIESMIIGFKHQIISADSANPEVEEIERVINEASALDNVLTERRRQRI